MKADEELNGVLGMLVEACETFGALLAPPEEGAEEWREFFSRAYEAEDRDAAVVIDAFMSSARQQLDYLVRKRKRDRQAAERQRELDAELEEPF